MKNRSLLITSTICIFIALNHNIVFSQSIKYENWETVYFEDFNYQNVTQLKQNWKIGYPYNDQNGNPVLVEQSYWEDDPTVPQFAGYANEKSLSFLNNANNETILRIEGTTRFEPYTIPKKDGSGIDTYKYSTGVLVNKSFIDYESFPNYNSIGVLNGMFEIRCKIPPNTAFMPAFWLFGSEGGYEEIDVFEVGYQNSEKNKITCSVHNTNFNQDPRVICGTYYELSNGKKFSDDYHTYSLIWSPTHLFWFVDGKNIVTTKNPYPGHGRLNTMQLILNLGIFNQANLDNNVFFDVDYVKVFKEKRNTPIFSNHLQNVNSEICYSNSRDVYFYIGDNGKIFNTFKNSWSGNDPFWENKQLTNNQIINAKSELEWSENRQCLFYIGLDNKLYNIFWNTWTNSIPFWDYSTVNNSFPANVNSNITWSENRKTLFYIGTDNRINCIYWDTWTNQNNPEWKHEIINPNFPSNASRELEWSENRKTLFYIGTDNKIYNIFWNTWTNTNPFWDFGLVCGIANVDASNEMTWSESRKALFYKGSDNKIYNIFWNTWSSPNPFWDFGLIDIDYEFDTHNGNKFFCEAFCKGNLRWNNEFDELTYIGSDDKLYSIYYDSKHSKWQLRCLKWQAIPSVINGNTINLPFLGPTDINVNYLINGNTLVYQNRNNSLSKFTLTKVTNFIDYNLDECYSTIYENTNSAQRTTINSSSLNSKDDVDNFVISPNPILNGELKISNSKIISHIEITLTNFYGNKVDLKYYCNGNEIICDFNYIVNGIYFLNIVTESGQETIKVIVNNK